MYIAGLQPVSLIDFPGLIAAVVFTQGCPWRCPYCHNAELVIPSLFQPILEEDKLLEHFNKRRKLIDGVVISGGEPTLHKKLPEFCQTIKDLGLKVKLDTNGIHPKTIDQLLNAGLIDYIAMDLKAGPNSYAQITGRSMLWETVEHSLNLIKQSNVDYEIRTTFIPSFHTEKILNEMKDALVGVKRYILQAFKPGQCLDPKFNCKTSPTKKELERAKKILSPAVEKFIIRD